MAPRISATEFHTLVEPPPTDDTKSEIENVLELTQLVDIDTDLYTNTRPLWHPPGARGIYGGAVIAQCLSAASNTVPNDFLVHSMHCYFVLAGNAEIPVLYHVERVRSGRSFATRTVQARQRGRVIFTTTLSFMRENSGGKKTVDHAKPMPFVPEPKEEWDEVRLPQGADGPFQSERIDILNNDSPHPHAKKTRQWLKARGKISPEGGHSAHLAAIAYMSDSYFIGTVARVHKMWRVAARRAQKPAEDEDVLKKLREGDVGSGSIKPKFPQPKRPEIGMMVSLDHTIYFHNAKAFRADEWIFTEMHSPWAGEGRGLVHQHMWTRDGTLIATCVQEGVVRVKQDEELSKPKI